MLHFINDIWQELKLEKRKLYLSFSAIMLATLVMMILLTIGSGLHDFFNKSMLDSGKDVAVMSGGTISKNFNGLHINQVFKLTYQDLQLLKRASLGIELILPQYSTAARLYAGKNSAFAQINTTTAELATIKNIKMEPGSRFVTDVDNNKLAKVIVLGEGLRKQLFGENINPIAQPIIIDNVLFKVIGIIKPKFEIIENGIPDNYQAWIPIATYEALTHPTSIEDFLIVPKPGVLNSELNKQILKLLALSHHLDPSDYNLINFTDFQHIQQKINNFSLQFSWCLKLIAIFTLMIAAIGIANLMFITVKNNTCEIGIRMALGATKYQILIRYLFEALLISIVGGLLGLGLAWILLQLFSLVTLPTGFTKFVQLPQLTISWGNFSLVLFCLMMIGLLAGLMPVLQALRLHPISVLTYEKL